jgi:Flp pilus assembly protein TadD
MRFDSADKTQPRMSWRLRLLWGFVAVGSLAFTLMLLASVHRQRLVDVKRKRIDVLAHQARWSANHAEPELALSSLRELATLDPLRPRLAYELGAALLVLGQVPEATLHLQRAVALAPGDALAWCTLARAQHSAGAHEPAAFAFERAKLLEPTVRCEEDAHMAPRE